MSRQSDVRECALLACQRVGLYRHVSDPGSDPFLDRPCAELVEASADSCPISPPYNDTLMTFRARCVAALRERGYERVRVYLLASIGIGGCGEAAADCWGDRVEIELPPLDMDWGGEFQDLSLSFDGGIYRQQAHGRWLAQARWSGDVATRAETAFNRLTLEAGAAFNLLPGDWLPLTVSAKGQSDQELDAVDMSAEARLAYVLPFNPTLQSGAYRPSAAPRINVIAAYGRGLVRPDEPTDSSARTLSPQTPAASLRRVGYETWWRLPVSDNMLLNIHHAGLWNRPDGASGDFHTLWDLAVEVDMGGVTYLVGYQRGSAAPLFVPIETTRAGLSFAVGGGTVGSGGC